MQKFKGLMSIFITSLIFFMMLDTRYTYALGDYLLEAIGVKAWTGDHTGTHLTVVYFGIIFIVSILFIKKFAYEELGMRRRNIVLVFVLFITMLSLITDISARTIKSNSDGLLAVGFDANNSKISYSCMNEEYSFFIAEFELTNYSKDKKTFYISINNPFDREEGIDGIKFYYDNGVEASFELEGNETKKFELTSDEYIVKGGNRFQNGGGSGIVQEIILSNDSVNKVELKNNFLGIELKK